MRTKEQIIHDVIESRSTNTRDNAILEMLIDIRDTLIKITKTETFSERK